MGLKGVFLFTPTLTVFLVVDDMQMFSYRAICIFFHIEFFIQFYLILIKVYLIQVYFNFFKFYLIKIFFYSSLF